MEGEDMMERTRRTVRRQAERFRLIDRREKSLFFV
jgi:hypothetical protein